MSDTALRSTIIRLAHANPEMRPHLLPLLQTNSREAGLFKNILDSLWKSYKEDHPNSKEPPQSLKDQAQEKVDEAKGDKDKGEKSKDKDKDKGEKEKKPEKKPETEEEVEKRLESGDRKDYQQRHKSLKEDVEKHTKAKEKAQAKLDEIEKDPSKGKKYVMEYPSRDEPGGYDEVTVDPKGDAESDLKHHTEQLETKTKDLKKSEELGEEGHVKKMQQGRADAKEKTKKEKARYDALSKEDKAKEDDEERKRINRQWYGDEEGNANVKSASLRQQTIRLAATLPKGSPERKALLASLVTADTQTPLMKAADDILVDVAKALAAKVDGKVVEFKPTNPSDHGKPGYASGEIEVVLPVFPSISSQPASLGFRISTGEAEGQVQLHAGPLYGTLHNGPEQKLFQTFAYYETGLLGTPGQVQSKINSFVSGLMNVLQPSIAKEQQLRDAHKLFAAAVPEVKKAIEMALKPLGMTGYFTHGPGAAGMGDNGAPYGIVRLTASGLLTDPSRDAARLAYTNARKALVKALSRVKVGPVMAKMTSEPGYWSAMQLETSIVLFFENMVPKVAASRSELLTRAAAMPKGSSERKALLKVLAAEGKTAGSTWQAMLEPVRAAFIKQVVAAGVNLLGDYTRSFARTPAWKGLELTSGESAIGAYLPEGKFRVGWIWDAKGNIVSQIRLGRETREGIHMPLSMSPQQVAAESMYEHFQGLLK